MADEEPQILDETAFADFTFSDTLAKLGVGAPSVGIPEAAGMLTARILGTYELSGDLGQATETAARGVAAAIARALPAEMLNPATLAAIDVRPFIQVAVEKNLTPVRIQNNAGFDDFEALRDMYAKQIRNPDTADYFAENTPVVLTELMTAANEETVVGVGQTGATANAPNGTAFLDPVPFTPGVAGLSPAANISLNTQGYTETGVPTASTNPDPSTSANGAPVYPSQVGSSSSMLTEEDVLELLRQGNTSVEQIAAGAVGGQNADPSFNMTGNAGFFKNQPGTPVTVRSAFSLLSQMSESEVVRLQDEMQAAGYFELVGGEPDPGNQFDEATRRAYGMAISDALTQGKPFSTVIRDRKTRLQSRTAQSEFGTFAVTEARAKADEIALELVGRRLKPTEFAQVAGFLRKLRDDRADDVPGVDDMNWASDAAQAIGFDTPDISTAVFDQVGAEAEIEAFRGTMAQVNAKWGLDARDEGSPMPRIPVPEQFRNDQYGSANAADQSS